jgi:hypothetical protein
MKTQILISINTDGLKDISLIAENESECKEIMETYGKYESEILSFLSAMKQKQISELSKVG